MGFLYIIPILAFLIIIHELGHFFAARSVGVKVDEFGVGIPPRIKGWRKGGVLWSLNAIPFGGFVRVKGEDAKDMEPGSMNAATPWQRAWFLFAGPLMNLLVALILATILVATQGVPARDNPLYVASVAPNSPALQAGWQPGDRITAINGTSYTDQGEAIKAIKDGAGTELSVTIMRGEKKIDSKVTPRRDPPNNQGALGISFPVDSRRSTVSVHEVKSDSAAQSAGIQKGDKIVAINGHTVESFAQAQGFMNASSGTDATITIERSGQRHELRVNVPPPTIELQEVRENSPTSDARLYKGDVITKLNDKPIASSNDFVTTLQSSAGKTVPVTVTRDGKELTTDLRVPSSAGDNVLDALGLSAGVSSGFTSAGIEPIGAIQYESVSPARWIPEGWHEFWYLISAMTKQLQSIFSGQVQLNQLAGPIGMGQMTGEMLNTSPQDRWITLTQLTIMISLSLGIFNLLPFPALDGGRLMFVALEILRGGKRLAPEKEGIVHMVGMLILLGLMFLVAYGDIARILDGRSLIP